MCRKVLAIEAVYLLIPILNFLQVFRIRKVKVQIFLNPTDSPT